MAYGPGETDTTAICCRELFTAEMNVLEQNKTKHFVKSATPDSKILSTCVRAMYRYTRY